MKRARRWLVGGAALITLGSCTSAPRPAPRPVPPPIITPQPPVLTPARFSYTGVMTQGGVVLGIAPRGTTLLTLDGAPVPVAIDGRFLIGFDRDASATARLVATLSDGRQVTDLLAIAPRAWEIERLATLPKYTRPSAEFERLRPPELAQIAAARRADSQSDGWRQQFLWPAIGRISGLFGSQRIYKGEPGAYHPGIDVAKPTGAPVLAPADGVVILAADHPFTLEGNLSDD